MHTFLSTTLTKMSAALKSKSAATETTLAHSLVHYHYMYQHKIVESETD